MWGSASRTPLPRHPRRSLGTQRPHPIGFPTAKPPLLLLTLNLHRANGTTLLQRSATATAPAPAPCQTVTSSLSSAGPSGARPVRPLHPVVPGSSRFKAHFLPGHRLHFPPGPYSSADRPVWQKRRRPGRHPVGSACPSERRRTPELGFPSSQRAVHPFGHPRLDGPFAIICDSVVSIPLSSLPPYIFPFRRWCVPLRAEASTPLAAVLSENVDRRHRRLQG